MLKKKLLFLKSDVIFYSFTLIAMLVRYLPFGMQYFTYQDDNNQYGIFYLRLDDILNKILLKYLNFTTRPIAALLDSYFISQFWNNLWIILVLITLLHFYTVIMLNEIFKKTNVVWGRFASILFAIYPLLFEATYWISASSRIVVGTFFAVWSGYILIQIFDSENRAKKLGLGVLFLITNILSMGFYEQVSVFSFVLTIFIIFSLRRIHKKKYIYWAPFLSITLMTAYYYTFKNIGQVAKRGGLIKENIFEHIIHISKNMINVFTFEHFSTLKYTMNIYFIEFIKNYSFLAIILGIISIFIALFIGYDFRMIRKKKSFNDNRFMYWKSIIVALVIIVISFSPFYILEKTHIYSRNVFISFIGLGILLEVLVGILVKYFNSKYIKNITVGIISTFIFFSIITNIAEVKSLSTIKNENETIAQNITNLIDYSKIDKINILVFNVSHRYSEVSSSRLENATTTSWAFNGIMQIVSGKLEWAYMNPILPNKKYKFDFDKDDDIFVGVDNYLRAHRLDYKKGTLYYENTNKIFGVINNVQESNMSVFQKY